MQNNRWNIVKSNKQQTAKSKLKTLAIAGGKQNDGPNEQESGPSDNTGNGNLYGTWTIVKKKKKMKKYLKQKQKKNVTKCVQIARERIRRTFTERTLLRPVIQAISAILAI